MTFSQYPSSSSSEISQTFGGSIRSRDTSAPSWRIALLRGIVWGLIGMIYAPLFTGLAELFQGLGFGHGTYIAAAALAGAVGAALYGAREVALIATGIGVLVGVIVLMFFDERIAVFHVVLVAGGVAGLVGLAVSFPARCSRHVPGKTMAGLATGAICGGVLALVEPFHPNPFSSFAVLAFLVSVNGVLYVSTVRWWLSLSHRIHCESKPCYIIESLVMATLAGLAAGSVWMMIGPLIDFDAGLWQSASAAMHDRIPMAILGGLFGGALAGMLLEFFRFSWVHDL
ncbi:hypothetical protein [Thiocapsa bogorovii]|uniref:hypothetical protein n=1 Tax=Thiocapsa bogorovii TaxID=521689 RepID=UPI001E59ABEE|nr:hypothetical protein [Thiocapsa bogorovii]UHD15005.1 hypothetical protein LT988_17190 [Thiocapsa bogorovii]